VAIRNGDEMNGRERFCAVMDYALVDRLPITYFGTWPETKVRWRQEGLDVPMVLASNGGPQLSEMDTDWEMSPDNAGSIWDNQGLLDPGPRSNGSWEVLAEDDDTCTWRTSFGGIVQTGKHGSSIPHMIEPDLKPTHADWHRFKKFLDPSDPVRWSPGWQNRAEWLNQRSHMTCFFGGSLFGKLRDWLGVEAISYLQYDDPALYEEMIEFQADYYIELNRSLLQHVSFDFAYIFEDCCGKSGPLFSPDAYKQFYDKYYRRLVEFYHAQGVRQVMLDSDGKIDDLLPLWLDSGIDIIFPIEVGTWQADPVALRKRYGRRLKMIGGIDKNLIPRGAATIRAHLEHLRPIAEEGGYIPMPDHRIPPDCSLNDFVQYLSIFNEVFCLKK